MSVRKCDYDQNEALFGCSIHNGHYCLEHHTQHVCDGQQHASFRLSNPSKASLLQLKPTIISKISSIHDWKLEITKKFAESLQRLRELFNYRIEILNKEISYYMNTMVDENFDNDALVKLRIKLNTDFKKETNELLQGLNVKFLEYELQDQQKKTNSKESLCKD
jgi:hypothetical protein